MTHDGVAPTGEWAAPYAARLPLLDGLDENPWHGRSEALDSALQAWGAPFGDPEPTMASVEARRIDGPHGSIPLRIYRPVSAGPSGVALVWYHGGGFVAGDLDMAEADLVARGLVTRTGAVVVTVDYRLCLDGVHHPVPHDDAYRAYRWVKDHAARLGCSPGLVAVGGASAGGCLAASVALRGRDEGVAPARVLLAYPVLHGVLPAPSAELARVAGSMPTVLRFPEDVTVMLNRNYLGTDDPAQADPYAFPGHATDLRGFPPTYIENSEFDDLRSSGEEFARQLAAAGAPVELATAAGVPHGHLDAVGSALTAASLDRFAARLRFGADLSGR